MFDLGYIISKIFQNRILSWIIRFIFSLYTCFLIKDAMSFHIINDRECLITLKNTEKKFHYHKFPKNMIIKEQNVDLLVWQGDDWNYAINLPHRLKENQLIYIYSNEDNFTGNVFTSKSGHIEWDKYFKENIKYTFHDDLE